jgi:hypothetical protein
MIKLILTNGALHYIVSLSSGYACYVLWDIG